MSHALREVILDIETTGLDCAAGDKIISVGIVEMINGVASGNTLHVIVNPGRDSHPSALAVHRMTPEFLAQFAPFAAHAAEIRNFIGDSPIVITCRTTQRDGKDYTLDEAFITTELAAAGITPPPATQWINVRRWSEALYGQDGARLDAVLDRYGINRSTRDEVGHGALLDAELLAAAYPRLKREYMAHVAVNPPRITAAPLPKR